MWIRISIFLVNLVLLLPVTSPFLTSMGKRSGGKTVVPFGEIL